MKLEIPLLNFDVWCVVIVRDLYCGCYLVSTITSTVTAYTIISFGWHSSDPSLEFF